MRGGVTTYDEHAVDHMIRFTFSLHFFTLQAITTGGAEARPGNEASKRRQWIVLWANYICKLHTL